MHETFLMSSSPNRVKASPQLALKIVCRIVGGSWVGGTPFGIKSKSQCKLGISWGDYKPF